MHSTAILPYRNFKVIDSIMCKYVCAAGCAETIRHIATLRYADDLPWQDDDLTGEYYSISIPIPSAFRMSPTE